MIIWGSRGRKKDVSAGEFYCPSCETYRPYKRKKIAKYFTLYFVPLFETDNLGEYIECQGCQSEFRTEVLNYEPPSAAEQLLVGVKRELALGLPFHMLQKKLTGLGLDEAGAMQIIDIAAAGYRRKCSNCGFQYIGSVESCSNCGNSLRETKTELFGGVAIDFPKSGNRNSNQLPSRQAPMSPELHELFQELHNDSAKRRWSTIQRLIKLNVRDERIVAKIAEMAAQDKMDYVKTEAQKFMGSSSVQALVREMEQRNREDQQSVQEIQRILSVRGLI